MYVECLSMHGLWFIVALSCCIWAYLLLGRGFFWRLTLNPQTSHLPVAQVVAVVPARNEAETIGRCVSSVLRQTFSTVTVVVVDDASTDGTADAARSAAVKVGSSDRLTVISGKPLPEGWTGKLWAVHQGVQRALELHPDFLLLTDADIEHGPETIGTLVDLTEHGSLDLTSYMVKLHCASFAEKLLIPAFVYFFFQLYPPDWIADSRSRTAGAAGGCMLVRAAALSKIGGIETIRSEIIDDCALAAAIKRTGGRIWLGVTDHSRSLRPYDSFGEIGRMIARTAFNQLRHSTLLLVATIVGLVATYLVPVALPFLGWTSAAGLGRVALFAPLLLMGVSYVPMVRFYRLNPLWAFTLPFASIFYMGSTLWSAVQYWSGRGGQWKGRAQDKSHAVAK